MKRKWYDKLNDDEKIKPGMRYNAVMYIQNVRSISSEIKNKKNTKSD